MEIRSSFVPLISTLQLHNGKCKDSIFEENGTVHGIKYSSNVDLHRTTSFDREDDDNIIYSDGDDDDDLPPNERSLKKRAKKFIHSRPFHIMSVSLVIADCVLVLAEILMDLYLRDKEEEAGDSHAKVDDMGTYIFRKIHKSISYISLGILSLFVIERTIKVFVDFPHFRSHKMEIFDAIIVMGSFAIDISVMSIGSNDTLTALGLIVILRLWRVVRIINGIIVGVKKNADKRVHALKAVNKTLQDEIDRLEKMNRHNKRELSKIKKDTKMKKHHHHHHHAHTKHGSHV